MERDFKMMRRQCPELEDTEVEHLSRPLTVYLQLSISVSPNLSSMF